MKAKYLGLLLIGAMTGLSSCNNYLDMTPTDAASDKLVWSNENYANLAVNYFYADIPYMGSFNDYECVAGMTEGLTDEFKYGSMNYNAECYIPSEISYGGSTLTASYVSYYMGVWGSTYEEIRRVNEALANLAKYGKFSDEVTTRLKAELRFFRGMYYFELMKRHHQAILYDEDLTKISTDKALNTEAECWDFVEADLEYAGQNLQVSTTPNGRLTSGAAYALLSRAMLYAERYDVAKTAAKKVIDMGYSLTSDYASAFESGNSEAIFQYTYSYADNVTHSFDGYYAPGGDQGDDGDGNTMTGGYGTPTQDMVEEYELATGGKPDWSTWHSTSGVNDTPPYDKLEPRFKATVLYNGSSWKDRTIQPYVGGKDGWATWKTEPTPSGRTTTGYYLRKYVDETHHFTARQVSYHPWIAFRLAEVYLNYAEACYRTNDATTALTYINKVRARVGLPSLTNLTGDNLFAALRHERKVELAYEGLYYWDLRRWGLAETELTGIRRHGLKIEKNADGSFTYTYVNVDTQDMNYPAKMNRIPIPTDELNNNKSIEQFTEWK